jgi:hypothetical protein
MLRRASKVLDCRSQPSMESNDLFGRSRRVQCPDGPLRLISAKRLFPPLSSESVNRLQAGIKVLAAIEVQAGLELQRQYVQIQTHIEAVRLAHCTEYEAYCAGDPCSDRGGMLRIARAYLTHVEQYSVFTTKAEGVGRMARDGASEGLIREVLGAPVPGGQQPAAVAPVKEMVDEWRDG